MPTSGVEEAADRLLEAFHDLSDGDPARQVSLWGGNSPQEQAAASRAGLDDDSVSPDIAARYLSNLGYILSAKTSSGTAAYTITPAGVERVKKIRGLLEPAAPNERSGMSDKTQRRLITLLSTVIALYLSGPVNRYIDEMIPERRGVKDDLLESSLQGLVRGVSIFLSSIVVRFLVGLRG